MKLLERWITHIAARRATDELSALGDRELADMGIHSRGMIPYLTGLRGGAARGGGAVLDAAAAGRLRRNAESWR
jgi:hypothetical protein